jgi:hypothetical protein
MAYCSIAEAFPVPTDPGQPGRVARKEERRRAKSCKGPALSFLKGGGDLGVDVDRQSWGASAAAREPELLTNDPSMMKLGWEEKEGFQGDGGREPGVDVIGSNTKLPDPKVVGRSTTLPKLAAETPRYFGAGEDGIPVSSTSAVPGRTPNSVESFADFSSLPGDNPGYQLKPDFLGSFGAVGYEKSTGRALLDTPNLNDAWKPLTGSGATTSFFEKLPWPGGRSNGRSNGSASMSSELCSMSREEKEALVKKIDLLFAKLERLEGRRNENASTEVALFVLSGIFLMFGLDVVRRTSGSA